ncbi:glycosyltransferase [Candidatus Roizmanbacteria bacterium]|nr:glycosyltransferase [Candidatus Roizmanbacteria bacterium]
MLKISIVTPSFNQGQYIEQTIQSVLNQNYSNLEYIVMDGGSTDNTLSILKKYEGKLKWFSEKDKGQSDAINKGLKMATGDVVAWLNSDDYYLPDTLQKVADEFERNMKVQWVTGDYIIVDEKRKQIQSFVSSYKSLLRKQPTFNMLSFANFIIQPSTFWKREMLKKIGYLREEYHLCMDYDLWLRLMRSSPPSVITSPLSAFRIHGTSKGKLQYGIQFKEEVQVAKQYNHNGLIIFLHKIHNILINFVYQIIKS